MNERTYYGLAWYCLGCAVATAHDTILRGSHWWAFGVFIAFGGLFALLRARKAAKDQAKLRATIANGGSLIISSGLSINGCDCGGHCHD